MLDVDRYFQRIDYRGSAAATIETLYGLHLAHLLAVPFENLDIHLGRTIVLDEEAFYNKIVERKRGGFCYELNGLFAVMLRRLGFRVSLLSAEVARDDGSFSPAFDHLVLIVDLDERWLVDVGFGDSFVKPLWLMIGEQEQGERVYRIDWNGEYYILRRRGPNEGEEAMYRFTLEPHELSEFSPMCHFQQTSAQSHFMQHRICTRMTDRGRVTLSDLRLIVTADGQRDEQQLADEQAFTMA